MKSLYFTLPLVLLISACDATKALDSAANKMPNTMDSMNTKMDNANKGVDNTNAKMAQLLGLAQEQKLSLALDNMLREENTRDLEPIALGMLSGAEKFGQAVTSEDMIKFVFVLTELTPDPHSRRENFYFV